MVDLSSLNERQLQAVQWQTGPALVLAGPGSGKTKVLTTRIARIIEATRDEHFRVLGLTFTNAAASAMRQRIEALVPGASNRFLLTTFHSFAGDLLRQHGHLIGLRPDFTILSQDGERIIVLNDVISSLEEDYDLEQYTGEKILPLINRMIERDVSGNSVDAVADLPTDERRTIIEAIRKRYRDHLIKGNNLDFPSMISEAVRLLRDVPAVCKQTRRIYRYLCVDEFQDTNLSQYALLKYLIEGGENNLFVVADDDQIIYQWNGASPERLALLKTDFSMEVIQLPANYRCPPAVIELANKLISHNASRTLDKDSLLALKPGGSIPAVRLYHFPDFEAEAGWVAADIAGKPSSDRARSVVLARTRKALEVVVEQLEKNNVPAYLAMRKDEFVSAPLRWLHAAIKLANNPQDRSQLQRLARAFYDLEGLQIDTDAVAANAKAFEGSALRAFADLALARSELSDATRAYLRSALPPLTDRLDFRFFCKSSFPWFQVMQGISPDTQGHFTDYADEKVTWETLLDEIDSQFGVSSTTLNVLVQELDMRSKTPPPAKGAVPCFTIHASKGMEFAHVYLIGMVEDQLPSWGAVKKGPQSQEIQEERRNCFVAITRTEETLTMTYSQRMFGWSKNPSRLWTH